MIHSMEDAEALCKHVHRNQKDKSGVEYWKHPKNVATRLASFAPNEVLIAAYLHDVLEDTKYDEEDLRFFGVGEASIDLIKMLTRGKYDPRTYQRYIEDIASSGNVWAILIKLSDNIENWNPERVLPRGYETLAGRYKIARDTLVKALVGTEYEGYEQEL